MENHEEDVMEIPRELVENSGGFAIDWGASAIKLVYLHKEDAEKLYTGKQKPDKLKIRLALYSVSQSKEALSMLRNNCYIIREKDACPLVYITGIGCNVNENTIANELGVRCQNIFEVDIFVKALFYLVSTATYNEFVHIPSREMRAKFEGSAKVAQVLLDHLTRKPNEEIAGKVWNRAVRDHPDGPIAQTVPDIYPCMMFVISSAFWSTLINKDRTYNITTFMQCGGHPFLGLGAIICGTLKTYDELIDLAEQGDLSRVDDYFADVLTEGKDDSYGTIFQPEFQDFPAHCLRKVAYRGAETGRLEDRVLSFVRTTCLNIAVTMINTMVLRKVKHAFITGSFANRKLVRELIETEFHRQRVFLGHTMGGQGLDCEIHFLRKGSHMGALGALIYCTDPKLPTYKY